MNRIRAAATLALALGLPACAHRAKVAAPPAPELFAPSDPPQGRFEPASPGSEYLEPTVAPPPKGSTAPAPPRRKSDHGPAPESATLKPVTPPGAPAPEAATLRPVSRPATPATEATTRQPTSSAAQQTPQQPAPAPPQPVSPAPPPPARSSGGDSSSAAPGPSSADALPAVVQQVPPSYPHAAIRAGVEGTVVVEAHVRVDGTVAETRVTRSIPELDEAAAACVKRWAFKPATAGGAPVDGWVKVPVQFDFPAEALGAGSAVPDSLGRCSCTGRDAQQLPDLYPHDPCDYPASARDARIKGTVLVMAFVLSSGRVAKTRILRSVPALDAAAQACVRSWSFLPGRCCRRPAGTWVVVPVDFQLH